jgi:hypothetical protein
LSSATVEGVTSVVIGSDAADLLDEILTLVCRDTLAVSMVTRSGETIGAVLLSHNGQVVMYEQWDAAVGTPNGEPMVIAVAEIAEIRVF